MPEIVGRLRPPRLSTAPSSPAPGEEYFDTTLNELLYWSGTAWVGGSGTTVYEQPGDPGTVPNGSIWIDTDDTPPVGPTGPQ
jgi:hypothetical protein